MNITEVSVKRPVFTLMVYAAATVFSLYALSKLPIDLYPKMENPVISVVTFYPGASSKDVEEKVTDPIEKGLAVISNLDEITSSSYEGYSVVTLKFDYSTDLNEAANDIRSGIDFVKKQLPDTVENPLLFKFSTALMPVYFFAITSDTRKVTDMKTYFEDNILEYLQTIPGVGSASLFRIAAEEVHIDARLKDLNQKKVTLLNIMQAISTNNVSMPAGSIENKYYDLPVRIPSEYQSIKEIKNTMIGAIQGKPIYIHDVANVKLTHKKLDNIAKLNKKSVSVCFVQKQSNGNTVAVAKAIKKKLKEIRKNIPDDIKFIKIFDGSQFIVTMIGNLTNSILFGSLFVIIVVLFFLRRFRASFIIAMSLPSSILLSFLLIYAAGYTINSISLLSMALAIGMVVDNSIVVLENITRYIEKGVEPAKAAVIGTKEVGLAITASTLTTIGIFAPMIFITGIVSVMFGQLAYIMIVTLLASLVTSIFLTPMLASKLLKKKLKKNKTNKKKKDVTGNGNGNDNNNIELREGWMQRFYRAIITWAVNNKLLTIFLLLALFGSSIYLVSRIGFNFLPEFDTGDIQATIELPAGVSKEVSETLGDTLNDEIRQIAEVKRVFFRAGSSESGFGAAMGRAEGVNLINLHVKLYPVDKRKRGFKEVSQDIRKIIENKKNVVSFNIKLGSAMSGSSQTKPVVIQVMGSNYERMKQAALDVKKTLEKIKGLINISTDIAYEKPEVYIDLNRKRTSEVGVNAAMVTKIVSAAIMGQTISRYRGEHKDIDIILEMQDKDINNVDKIKNIGVPGLGGKPVMLGNISTISNGFSPININHSQQLKVINVEASTKGIALNDVATKFRNLIAPLRAKYSDIVFNFGGNLKDQQDTKMDLMIVLLLGLLLTYMIMASQFESFIDPFVIMFSIPFAFSGSFLLLFLTKADFNVVAFLGLIMLIGIVVNNGIVLIDYIQHQRADGVQLKQAVINASVIRLRPILMTATTTIFGMIPLALASGEGYELWQPIGITVIGGLLLSTLVTLVLIPILYASMEKIRRKKTQSEIIKQSE